MTDFTDNFKAVKLKIMFKIIQHKNSNKVSVLFFVYLRKPFGLLSKRCFHSAAEKRIKSQYSNNKLCF